MKLQARNFVVLNSETIDITMFFKKFCIATRTIRKALETARFQGFFFCRRASEKRAANGRKKPTCGAAKFVVK